MSRLVLGYLFVAVFWFSGCTLIVSIDKTERWVLVMKVV